MCILHHLTAIKNQNIYPFTQIFVPLLLHPLTTVWSPPPINRGRAPSGLFPPSGPFSAIRSFSANWSFFRRPDLSQSSGLFLSSGPFSVILSFPAIRTFLSHPNLYKLFSLFSYIHFSSCSPDFFLSTSFFTLSFPCLNHPSNLTPPPKNHSASTYGSTVLWQRRFYAAYLRIDK